MIVATMENGMPASSIVSSQRASGRGIDMKFPREFWQIPRLPSSGQSVLLNHCRMQQSLRRQTLEKRSAGKTK
jgi:hypothetical protein